MLGNKIKRKNLYIRVFENRQNLQDRLKNWITSNNENVVYPESSLENKINDLTEKVEEIDSLDVLQILKSDIVINPILKEIRASPFFLIYWFPDQINFWKNDFFKLDVTLTLSISVLILQKTNISGVESENTF